MLLNHSNIKKVQEKPIVLKWLSDPSDPSDHVPKEETENIAEKQKELELESRSDRSDRSDCKEEYIRDEDCETKLLNISGNKKGQPIEMTKEEYDSWEGVQENPKFR